MFDGVFVPIDAIVRRGVSLSLSLMDVQSVYPLERSPRNERLPLAWVVRCSSLYLIFYQEELFALPFVGWVMASHGGIPINRRDRASAVQVSILALWAPDVSFI